MKIFGQTQFQFQNIQLYFRYLINQISNCKISDSIANMWLLNVSCFQQFRFNCKYSGNRNIQPRDPRCTQLLNVAALTRYHRAYCAPVPSEVCPHRSFPHGFVVQRSTNNYNLIRSQIHTESLSGFFANPSMATGCLFATHRTRRKSTSALAL